MSELQDVAVVAPAAAAAAAGGGVSHPVAPELRITGCWTKAGIASCIRLQGPSKSDDFLLDCGTIIDETVSCSHVFITHGHLDHIGGCIAHARAKQLTGGQAVYYVPSYLILHLHEARVAFEKLNGAPIQMDLRAISPEDATAVSFGSRGQYRAYAFATTHRVPSQGYAIAAIRQGGLLDELRHLSTKDIQQLKRQGQAIRNPDSEVLQVVYTGDTTFEGLVRAVNASLLQLMHVHTLIIELTYLDGSRDSAARYGHVHIADIVENEQLLLHCDRLLFVHLSQKYSVSRAVKLLRDQLPPSLLHKSFVSLHSFGAEEHMTALADSKWDVLEQQTAGWGWSSVQAIGPSRT